MKRDRFEVIYDAAIVLVRAGRVDLATVLMEEFGFGHPPQADEPTEYYNHITALRDILRPVGAEIWACEVSPDGFCHNDGRSGTCKHCGEMVERW